MTYTNENCTRVQFRLYDGDAPLLAEAIIAEAARYKAFALRSYRDKDFTKEGEYWDKYNRLEHLASQLLDLDEADFMHLVDIAQVGGGRP